MKLVDVRASDCALGHHFLRMHARGGTAENFELEILVAHGAKDEASGAAMVDRVVRTLYSSPFGIQILGVTSYGARLRRLFSATWLEATARVPSGS